MQTHDEFFKVRPGLWGLTAEKDKVIRLCDVQSAPEKQREYSHYFFQGLIVEIGNFKGFETFVPIQDKNKPFAQKKLGDISTLSKLYEFTYTEVLRRAQTIDVAWLNIRKYPDSFFEIEHSTDIYNSLLKFVELQDFRVKFYIVADNHRKMEFNNKITLNAFTAIKPFTKFLDYDTVAELHTKVSESAIAERALLYER